MIMTCLAETYSSQEVWGAFWFEIADFSVLFIIVIEPSNGSCRFKQYALLEHTLWKHKCGWHAGCKKRENLFGEAATKVNPVFLQPAWLALE